MKEQGDSYAASQIALRLAEERKRRFPHQGDFARSLGISQGRQSLYERGERGLSVEYLGTLAGFGFDLTYIITGRHSAESLDEIASDIVTAVRALGPAQQHALLAFLATLSPEGSTLHDRHDAFDAGAAA